MDRVGVDIGALAPVVRNVEGVVEMVLDATANFSVPLSAKRLFGWHAALFPMGYSGLTRIRVGAWRDDATGPMQVVSGPDHRRKVHYEGPGAGELKQVMPRFFNWANATASEPALIKAGLAHLWFVTRLPFDDGNGRIARAVTSAQSTLDTVLAKARFWGRWAQTPLNERQVKLLNRLLDGFDSKLNSSKWAAIAKCSPDTALRDINELVSLGVLVKSEAGGRSTAYELGQ